MNSQDIIAIIKWGPLLLFLLIFLFGLISGLIRGRRKVLKHTIYSLLYVVLLFIFTPKLAKLLMLIPIDGVQISTHISNFISSNETINGMVRDIPGIQAILATYPSAIISLVLFFVLILIKPLLFPLYIVYSIFFNLISKHVFKYSKYKKDEEGKILRNEKGKKIKDKKDKHRLTGGLVRGFEYTMLTSIVLMPVGVITRLYNDAKEATSSKDLSSIEYLEKFDEYLSYVDAFNDSLLGKATNSIVNEKIAGYLTTIEIDGNKTTIENELSNIVVAALYLEESGLIKLLSKDLDVKTLDLSKLDLNKIDLAINKLFNSLTLNIILKDGVNYVLENNLKQTLVDFTNDGEIINKIKYSSSSEIKQELFTVTNLIRDIINSKLLETYQNAPNNVMTVVNEVTTQDVEIILNRILSIKILSKAMPSIMTKLLNDAGLKEALTQEDNGELVDILIKVLKFAKTLEIDNIDKITDGDVLDNVVNILYKEGAIKENSMDSLSLLLAEITSSNIFDDILVTQLNNLLSKYEINLNSQMIVNVKTSQDWKKELRVLEDIFKLYDTYKKDNKVEFLIANELLEDLKDTKAMILAFPIAYQKLFPSIGIEIDSSKIEYIDYTQSGANEEEIKFYNYWKSQLVHLEVISEELAKLKITSFSDLSLDLLELDSNVESIATIIAEVFSTDLLKDGVTTKLSEVMSDLLANYEITLNRDAISNVNKLVDTMPYYIKVSDKEYDIELVSGKYYIGADRVEIVDNKVNYGGSEHSVSSNNLTRVWKKELSNLATIVKVIKTADYTSKENLTKILDSVDNMYLLKDVKTDLLIYAVKQINIIDTSTLDKSKISFSKEKIILLNVIDKYETLKDIQKLEFSSISDEEIDDLAFVLSNVLDSDIFGNYAADSVVSLARNADVELDKQTVLEADTWVNDLKLIRTATNLNKDSFDKDTMEELLNGIEDSSLLGETKNQILLDTAKKIEIQGVNIPETLKSDDLVFSDEKAAILAASDNLSLLEDMSKPDSDFELSSVDSDKISELLATSIQSKMFGNSVVNTLVDVFKDNSIKHDLDTTGNTNLINSIKSVGSKENWKKEIDLIKTLLEIDTKEEVDEDLFNTLEDPNETKLLSGCRANLLLRMIKEIDDAQPDLGIDSTITVSYLVDGGSYNNYDIEVGILLDLVNGDNLDLLEDMSKSTFKLSNVDSDKMSELLANTLKSKFFSGSAIDKLVDVFNQNSIKHDLDTTGNTNLINSIKSVDSKENWKKEINLIKTLLEIDTKEEVTKSLFDTIEDPNQTKLLNGCRANLLLRMITEIDKAQENLGINSDITVSYLVSDGTYKKYNIERDVLIDLVELDGITGISSINMSSKYKFAGMLNNMKNSTVFASPYNDIVIDITSSMASNTDLTDWGLSVDNTPDIVDWNTELTALLTVKNNAPTINEMTGGDVDPTLIGKTLDELDKSKIILGSERAANNIVKKFLGNSANISKSENQTWQAAFEEKLTSKE